MTISLDQSKRITLKHIAEAAGLSKSAVSLALRNHPSLPVSTRERVRHIAEAMGYRPDPALSALAGYRHGKRPVGAEGLAWITNWPTRDGWREVSPVYENYFAGARRRAEHLGFQLEHFWLREPGMSRSRFEQVLQARRIRGVILAPQPAPRTSLALTWARYAAVKIGYTLKVDRMHTISCSHFSSMMLVLRRLRERGYKRIGFALRGSVEARVEHAWLAGYLLERETSPEREPVPPLILRGNEKQRLLSWFRQHKPEAIVTAEPVFAMEVRRWLGEIGLDIPKDLGLAVVSNVPLQSEFSGIHEHSEQIGSTAVDVLARLLYQNELGMPEFPWRTLIDGTWVEGNSVRKVSSTAGGQPG